MAEKEFTPIAQMTFKKMGMDAKDAVRNEAPVFMGRLFGEAVAIKTKEAKNGDPYQYIVGTFRCITGDGKAFESEKLFLSSGLQESIETALTQAEGKAVEFAYDVFSVPDDKSSVGYKYAAKSLKKTETSDRLAVLSKEMEQLAKPKTEGSEKGAKKKAS